MPTGNENPPLVELSELNAELEDSISRCRRILSDCRSRLAANDDNGSGPANYLAPPTIMAAPPQSQSE